LQKEKEKAKKKVKQTALKLTKVVNARPGEKDKLEQKAENDRKTVDDLVKKDDRAFFEYMLTKDSFIKLILTSKEW
jgi:hypothetical protein